MRQQASRSHLVIWSDVVKLVVMYRVIGRAGEMIVRGKAARAMDDDEIERVWCDRIKNVGDSYLMR